MSGTIALPPMRSIKQAYEEIKAADENTALTLRGLRALVVTGAIPSVQVGGKYLINMDVLREYLTKGCTTEREERGVIRRIDERANIWR